MKNVYNQVFKLLRNRNSQFSSLKSQVRRGFTLIELITVVAIVGIIASVSIPSFVSYSNNQVLHSVALDIATMLNTAKSRSLSQVKPSQCEGQALSGYQVTLAEDGASYTLDVVCGSAFAVDSKNLPQNITFGAGSASTIFFPVLTDARPSAQKIQLEGYGKTKLIHISTTGSISVE